MVNAGNANAFTGMAGEEAVRETALAAAQAAGCDSDEVMIASTGVIGEPLEPARFTGRLGELAEAAGPDNWEDAARAIMTTDTFPKLASRRVKLGEAEVVLSGIAKGAGMIAPDMATMLAFVFTDAPIAAPLAQQLCEAGVEDTFNAITVDSDTSTSDTLLLFATGAAAERGVPELSDPADQRVSGFASALKDLMRDLAHQIVKDGEGASKFIAVTVEGAETKAAARRIAFAIANSPLVKTAFAGEDPNWGRIVMAVGKSGEAANRDKLAIWFGDIQVARDGEADPAYREAMGAEYMKSKELAVRADVGVGAATATVWTCDLTTGYIAINADYRS